MIEVQILFFWSHDFTNHQAGYLINFGYIKVIKHTSDAWEFKGLNDAMIKFR